MKTDLRKRILVTDLKKAKQAKLWPRIAKELERSTKNLTQINISKIQKNIRDDEIALVPGKVLSLGNMEKKLTIAAYNFSEAALEKINKNGKAILIEELLKQNPKGNKVRIIK